MAEYIEQEGTELSNHFEKLIENATENTVPITFICEFENSIAPTEFIDEVFGVDDKYQSIGFTHKLSSEDEYYSIASVINIDEGAGEKLDCELCPEWMRVYISGSENTDDLAEFFTTLYEDYPFTFTVAEEYLN